MDGSGEGQMMVGWSSEVQLRGWSNLKSILSFTMVDVKLVDFYFDSGLLKNKICVPVLAHFICTSLLPNPVPQRQI